MTIALMCWCVDDCDGENVFLCECWCVDDNADLCVGGILFGGVGVLTDIVLMFMVHGDNTTPKTLQKTQKCSFAESFRTMYVVELGRCLILVLRHRRRPWMIT